MENLTKSQFILLVLLVSFVTSLVTGIVAVSLATQNGDVLPQIIQRVVDSSGGKSTTVVENPALSQQNLVVTLVKNITPAVVSVIATKDVPVIEQYFVDPFQGDNFFQQFFPQDFLVPQYRQNGTQQQQVSAGTGFFVSSDGTIVTNRHVVDDKAAQYTVILNNGKKLPAKVIARDPVQDVAIIKVEGNNYSFIPLGNSDTLQVGQSVIAIGNALGEFQNTVSEGVISGLGRTVVAGDPTSGSETLQQVIQTDAAINPGNSGGPLLDLTGRAIGIDVAMAQGAQNVGFALPINVVKKAVTDVQKNGKIVYPYIGVRYVTITSTVKEEKKLSVDYGALILSSSGQPAVVPGSPGDKAGLKEGDIILQFGVVKINQNNTLSELIAKQNVGDKVTLLILRDGKQINVDVTLTERPSGQ